jgi:hypothetical protein
MNAAKKLERLIVQMENYLECWKQFNRFINIARGKKFNGQDESQFLEVKCVLTQELELILSSVQVASPSKEDIHAVIAGAPSLRFLSELNEGALLGVESQWHRIYIGWHSILGQLKVRQIEESSKGFLSGVFGQKSR